MQPNQTAIERAFELAKSGQYSTVNVIKNKLKAEGYAIDQVDGRALTAQLRALMKDAAPH
jgi:hypothetical protein